jgi:hypothetical protein
MMNRDVTYCKGKGCLLTETCKRYKDAQQIDASDNEQYYWFDHCDEESREAFVHAY